MANSTNLSLLMMMALKLVIATSIASLVPLAKATSSSSLMKEESTNEEERHALVQSGWWEHNQNILSHCDWHGIECDVAGSVVRIYVHDRSIPESKLQLQNLNVTAFPNLLYLQLNGLGLTGTIPKEVSTLSELVMLNLFNNSLEGMLPKELANLVQLESLDVSFNLLSGVIPYTIGQLKSLSQLFLGSNQFEGPIPSELGGLSGLDTLDLSNNVLNGSIPYALSHLENLTHLYLGSNNLEGPIPEGLGNLRSLEILDLSHNSLIGRIPSEIGAPSNLFKVYMGNNQLNGTVPPQLFELVYLYSLYLCSNQLSGSLPSEISTVANLRNLDLSHNHLTGKVPKKLAALAYINLSYNSFDFSQDFDTKTKVPDYCSFPKDSLIGYSTLNFSCCSSIQQAKASPSKAKKATVISLPVIGAIFLVLAITICYCTRHVAKPKRQEISAKSGDFFSIWNYDGKIAFEDIIEATEDFDIRYCIGTGAYGSVYIAKLPSGKNVALKKLHQKESQNPSFDKSFRNEAKLLSQIRHRNIVKLYGYCIHNRYMFLVYEYMERGSLFCVLRNDMEAQELDWGKRVNIIKGIAHALSYMHHDCTPPIVHRDITSNNVLLNSKLEAFVSDFGTARLLDPDSSNQTLMVGTRGYIAPELA